jgi:hypothetical protein
MALTKNEMLFDKNSNGVLEPSEQQKYNELSSFINVDEAAESKNPKSGTSVSTGKTKLTEQTARALMQDAAEDAGYAGKFSKADIIQFIKEFDAQQALQISKVVTSTAQKLTPGGTTQGAVDKTMESTAKTEFPSFFKPAEFASDWVWKKINFKDEKSLGAKSLAALSSVRGLVQSFQLLGVTNNDIRAAAKQIAMGKKTLDAYTVELQQIAKKEYPQFADRFKEDPTLTTYDIASPIVKMLAKTWEVDEKDVSMDDPIVMSYMHYAGADGKGQQPSRYELLLKAKSNSKYQKTQEANENARDAAVGLARAFGFGV